MPLAILILMFGSMIFSIVALCMIAHHSDRIRDLEERLKDIEPSNREGNDERIKR